MSKKYMSDVVPDEYKDKADMLAENHVNWLLDTLRPLMIEEFRHGYRHGWEDKYNLTFKEVIEIEE